MSKKIRKYALTVKSGQDYNYVEVEARTAKEAKANWKAGKFGGTIIGIKWVR